MELYDTNSDWSQARDLAANEPERLESLKRLFLIEAAKYSVLPLDDRRVERFDAGLAGRPQLVRGTSQLLFQGMGRLTDARCPTSRIARTRSRRSSPCRGRREWRPRRRGR
jgi:hypothetical protein